MTAVLRELWRDDAGYLLSMEAVAVGTVGIAGATVGIGAVSQSINDELIESAHAIRCLDQSYQLPARTGAGAWTAGSSFVQQSVERSRTHLNRAIGAPHPVDTVPSSDWWALRSGNERPGADPASDPGKDSVAPREELLPIRRRQAFPQLDSTTSLKVPTPLSKE